MRATSSRNADSNDSAAVSSEKHRKSEESEWQSITRESTNNESELRSPASESKSKTDGSIRIHQQGSESINKRRNPGPVTQQGPKDLDKEPATSVNVKRSIANASGKKRTVVSHKLKTKDNATSKNDKHAENQFQIKYISDKANQAISMTSKKIACQSKNAQREGNLKSLIRRK